MVAYTKTLDTITCLPAEVVSTLVAGENCDTCSLIQLTPAGITLAMGRADSGKVLMPPPTKVHSGW